MSGGARNRGDVVATVNGEAIPVERYQRRYQAYLDAYSRVYRDRFSPTLAEQLGLPQQAVNDLVQEAVVVQRARAEGLEVSDEELNAQVQAVPGFAENGRFSLARYQDFLRRRGMSASAFENDVRRELTRMKVETTVKAGIKVSDAELERAFALRREEVRAAWALVETAPLVAAATVSDEEEAEYLKVHPAEFQLPERRRVQYVTLAPKDFRPQLPDAEVEKYYTDHAKEFETPQQVHAAHVLVPVPQTGGSEAEDSARTKVADVIRRAKAGEDFARLAAEISEDPGSKSKGGDLGWISKGEMVPAFEAVAFTLRRGEISPEPVRSPFGFHAIKVFESRAAGKKPLKEVAAQIRDRLAPEAADKAAGAQTGETARFSRTKPAERLPGAVQLAALQSPAGTVAGPVKSPQGYYVLKVLERIAPNMADLAAERDRLSREVLTQKQSQAWEAWVSHARAAAKVEVLAAPKRS